MASLIDKIALGAYQIDGPSTDVLAIAIIATESSFRPWYQRTLERALVLKRLALGEDFELITIGRAQITVRDWRKSASGNIFRILFLSLNLFHNYQACKAFLHENDIENIEDAVIKFHGRKNFFYRRRLNAKFLTACSVVDKFSHLDRLSAAD